MLHLLFILLLYLKKFYIWLPRFELIFPFGYVCLSAFRRKDFHVCVFNVHVEIMPERKVSPWTNKRSQWSSMENRQSCSQRKFRLFTSMQLAEGWVCLLDKIVKSLLHAHFLHCMQARNRQKHVSFLPEIFVVGRQQEFLPGRGYCASPRSLLLFAQVHFSIYERSWKHLVAASSWNFSALRYIRARGGRKSCSQQPHRVAREETYFGRSIDSGFAGENALISTSRQQLRGKTFEVRVKKQPLPRSWEKLCCV